MKIIVDKKPKRCSECLFLGNASNDCEKRFTGCTILKRKICFEDGISGRLNNCPLKKERK